MEELEEEEEELKGDNKGGSQVTCPPTPAAAETAPGGIPASLSTRYEIRHQQVILITGYYRSLDLVAGGFSSSSSSLAATIFAHFLSSLLTLFSPFSIGLEHTASRRYSDQVTKPPTTAHKVLTTPIFASRSRLRLCDSFEEEV